MYTTPPSIENRDMERVIVSREISRHAWESEDVKLILSMTGIDVFSAVLITVEIEE